MFRSPYNSSSTFFNAQLCMKTEHKSPALHPLWNLWVTKCSQKSTFAACNKTNVMMEKRGEKEAIFRKGLNHHLA